MGFPTGEVGDLDSQSGYFSPGSPGGLEGLVVAAATASVTVDGTAGTPIIELEVLAATATVSVVGEQTSLLWNIAATAHVTVSGTPASPVVHAPDVVQAATAQVTTRARPVTVNQSTLTLFVTASTARVTVNGVTVVTFNPAFVAIMTQGTPTPTNRLQGIALRVMIWNDGWGDGSPVQVDAISADVDSTIFGMEPGGITPSGATVQCAGFLPSAVDPEKGRQRITVEAGLLAPGGTMQYETIFTGLTLGPLQRNHEARTWEMRASGYSSLLADRMGQTQVYYNFGNDGPIIRDLCAKVGVPFYSVTGSSYQMYSVDNNRLVLRAGTAPLAEIARMNAVALRPMWDDRFGTVRRDKHVTAPPSSSWTYEEGDPASGNFAALEWERERPWPASRSKIRVFGYRSSTPGTNRPNAGRRDSGSSLPNPDADSIAAESIEYPGLETDADCASVALDHMNWRNRVEDVATIRLPPNPYLGPCDVLTIAAAPGIGPIPADQDFLILGVHQHVAESWTTTARAMSTSTAGGGAGGVYSLKPTASFTVDIIAHVHQPPYNGGLTSAGLLDYDWTARCDGSGSTGEDGQGIDNLGFEWTSNHGAANPFLGRALSEAPLGEVFEITVDGIAHFLGDVLTTLVVVSPEGVRSDPVTHNT